jgi:hypothetical protein
MSLPRLLGTWFLLAVLMPVNGAIREFAFKRVMPAAIADVLSAVTGIALILGVTWYFFRIPADFPTSRALGYALMLVSLTVAYEFAIGRWSGRSWNALLENYAIWKGKLWPLVLLALALTPFLWRGRGRG